MIKTILSSSLIFMVIVIIRKIFRGKAGNVFLYSLWLLFAAGLVIPIFSFVLQDIAGWDRGRVKSPVSIMNFVEMHVTDTEKATEPVKQKESISEKEGEKGQEEKTEIKVKQDANRQKVVIEAGKSVRFRASAELWYSKKVFFIFWAVGAVVVLLRQLFMERAFRRQLIENREEVVCQEQRVYQTKGVKTPLLFRSHGLSLDIYLPETIMENETFVRHALLHENIHKKHGDIWWGYVRNFLVAVYWFYPIVWIAAVLSKRDCEYACDSSVMKDMSKKECISYGNSLLSLIQVGRSRDLFCTATAMKMKKSEMEVRIRMIKRGRKRNLFVTVFIMILLCAVGIAAFTDAMEPEKEKQISHRQKEKEAGTGKQLPSGQTEQENTLSVKEAEYKITDMWGADVPRICYEDDTRMIFSGYFGLFIYSREEEEIVQSLNLEEIGCSATQGDHYCSISVSEDGKTVYLHVMSDKKMMYQYSVDTGKLQYLAYNLPDKLYDREKWEKTNQSGIQCNGATIGDLVYWYDDRDAAMLRYLPLFYKPYGSCDFFEPEDIRDLSEVSFYANGREYVITDAKKLQWIENHFSNPVEEIKGGSACPFYHMMYLKRKDGVCGKVFPATDSCSVYQTGNSYYEYKKDANGEFNEVFWKLFGIEDIGDIR